MIKPIPRSLVVKLLAEAQKSPEMEVCGLIGADHGVASAIYPVPNIAPHPEVLFEMDPGEQIRAMRKIRESGEQLWAIYHSHPHAPATPSKKDLTDADYADALYLVISLNTEGVLEMRGYQLEGDKFTETALETME